MSDINPNADDLVSFNLINSNIITDSFQQVLVVSGLMSYKGAIYYDPSLNAKHTAFYPYFAQETGLPNDPNAYKYFLLQLKNNETRVIGVPWVLQSSYEVVTNANATIIITNFEVRMQAPILDLLNNLGAVYTYKNTLPDN